MPTDTSAEDPTPALLRDGELEIEGRLVGASNVVLRVWCGEGDERIPAVYKPIRGERPLWDFPDGTLAGREYAAWRIAEAGGWSLIPATVLRDGPLGPGTVQRWVGPLDDRPDHELVRVDTTLPDGYVAVVRAEDEWGRNQIVMHQDSPVLRSVATLDAVLNNADRKASALIEEDDGRVWLIDHGLTLHEEPKLRTVLWGFAGDDITAEDLTRLDRLQTQLRDGDLAQDLSPLLTEEEIQALTRRVTRLRGTGRLPQVPGSRYPLPWPLW